MVACEKAFGEILRSADLIGKSNAFAMKETNQKCCTTVVLMELKINGACSDPHAHPPTFSKHGDFDTRS